MQEILTKSYQGADLSGMTPGVIYLPISYDSTILAIKVKTDLNVAGDAEFVLTNLDGTEIAGTSLTIESGTKKAVLTALEIIRLEDADVLLKLVSGAVSSPITLVLVVSDDTYSDTTPALSDLIDVEIDDPSIGDALVFDGANWVNQPAEGGGASLPTGDLNAATNKLEKANGRKVAMTDPPMLYGEDFNGGDIDTEKFNSATVGSGGTLAVVSGKLQISSNNIGSGGTAGIIGKDVVDFTGKFIQVKLVSRTGIYPGFGFGLVSGAATLSDIVTGNGSHKNMWLVAGLANSPSTNPAATYCYLRNAGVSSSGSNVGNIGDGTFLRIENLENGDIRFRSSPNGIDTWTTLRTLTAQDLIDNDFTDLSAIKIFLAGGGTNSGAGACQTIFDDFTSDIAFEDTMEDKTLFGWWNAALEQFEPVSLVDLKAALDALP